MHARTLAWQADVNGNGSLDADEVRRTLKKPQFVGTAMDNLDIDGDGQVTLEEWLTAHWNTYSKSEAGCRASLKAIAQALERNSDAPPAPSPPPPPAPPPASPTPTPTSPSAVSYAVQLKSLSAALTQAVHASLPLPSEERLAFISRYLHASLDGLHLPVVIAPPAPPACVLSQHPPSPHHFFFAPSVYLVGTMSTLSWLQHTILASAHYHGFSTPL